MHRRRRRRFDAMTSACSYRMALSVRHIELRRNSGAQFHPEVDRASSGAQQDGGAAGVPHMSTTRRWPAVSPKNRS